LENGVEEKNPGGGEAGGFPSGRITYFEQESGEDIITRRNIFATKKPLLENPALRNMTSKKIYECQGKGNTKEYTLTKEAITEGRKSSVSPETGTPCSAR